MTHNHKPNPLVAHLGCDMCAVIEEMRPFLSQLAVIPCDDCGRADGTHDPEVEH